MFKKNILEITLLFLILLLGLILRLNQLGNIPGGFFADEASIGFNAYTIAIKGIDEYGKQFPIFFQAFGEYKNPLQIYSTVFLVLLFELNEFSTRLPSVIYGIFGILALYLLTKEVFKNHPQAFLIASLAAILLAISPWHLHFSRVSLEGLTAFVFLTTFATYLFLKSFSKPRYLIVSSCVFAISFYSYFPARIFLPLFIFTLLLVYHKFIILQKKIIIISLATFLILLLPLLQSYLSGEGLARWQQVSIFTQPPQQQAILQHILTNYLSHFSLEFLFTKGDIGMPGQFITRHSIKDFGQLYLFQLPVILLGIMSFYQQRLKKHLLVFLGWIIIAPVGSMFTIDQSAQATRSIIGVIPLQILSAAGILYIFHLFKKKALRIFLAILLVSTVFFSFGKYLDAYYLHYPLYSEDFWGWQYGPREIMHYFLLNQNSYDDLYLSGEFNAADIFIKFYDPQNLCLGKCKIGDFYRTPLLLNPQRKQLFSLSPDYLDKSPLKDNFIIRKTIYYPNGQIAFLIGEPSPF